MRGTSGGIGLTVGILAGGAGRRAGGADKGWLPRGGQARIEWLLSELAGQGAPVIISANRHLDRYRALGFTVVKDTIDAEPFPGPLAGVLALLEACPTSHLLTLPVDVAALPKDFVKRFGVESPGIVVARDAEGLQPLMARYPVKLLSSMRRDFAGGQRSVRAWQAGQGFDILDYSAYHFGNLNTREQLESS